MGSKNFLVPGLMLILAISMCCGVKPSPAQKTIRNKLGMIFLEIPAGEQVVNGENVRVSSFYMAKTEVTQDQWQQLMGNNPAEFSQISSFPVERVSWDDVQLFIAKLNESSDQQVRLPSEAEWVHAALGGGKEDPYGKLDEIAIYNQNSGMTSHPVAQKRENGYGLYDMLGNVYEWCADEYRLGDALKENQTLLRVIKGGSWYSVERNCRVTHRLGLQQGSCVHDLGFRLVLEPNRRTE